ncbi:MAG: IMP dehydrogenase [Nitrospirota bacterium]|nr:IMP dehydrogenase [Nitrospirota bacterium]
MLNESLETGLTFDDVVLIPARSEVVPAEVNTSARLTRDITLNIPVLSAAMDTITEAEMAIAMAQHGGIGIVHRACPIPQQAREVEKVKKSEGGMVVDPITVGPDRPIGEAIAMMAANSISGIPVVEGERLVGILTRRDLQFEEQMDRLVRDVMTHEGLVTTPLGTTPDEAKALFRRHRVEKLPVVDDSGNLQGLFTIKDVEKKLQFPNASKDSQGRLRVGAAVGVGADAMDRVQALFRAGVDVVVVDTAHGHSIHVLNQVREVKAAFPDLQVIGGNIATGEAALDLIKAGADGVKVGVGPGSICTTRMVSGAGMPQLTAIANVAKACAKKGIPVIGDGGIKYSGDVTKAIVGGADCVMMGSYFAGTDESPGEVILFQGRRFKSYRGMGSLGAMEKGSKDRYFQEGTESNKLVPEGIEGRVPYKGTVGDVLYQLVGGLRSGMGYLGCKTLPELQKNGRFIRLTHSGLIESHVHDVIVTKEAPNYQRES